MILRMLCLLLAGTSIAAATERRVYDFEVLLDGRPIGSHRYELNPAGAATYEVDSRASFDFSVLGVVLYRYRHEARERISGNCLERIEALTRDNGEALAVRGASSEGGFRLEAPAALTAPGGCVLGYAYWDLQQLLRRDELLNPQTGGLDDVRMEYAGEDSLSQAGKAVPARRYRLHSSRHAIDLWYSEDGEWLQLETRVRGGRQLRYQLRDSGLPD